MTPWKFRIIYLAGLFLFPGLSHAVSALDGGSCSAIRLDQKGGSMEGVVPLDQASVGSCYTHAAAQLADAWLRKSPEASRSHRTEPFVSYIRELTQDGKSPYRGGYTESALFDLKFFGSCDHHQVFQKLDGQEMNDFLIELRTEWEDFRRVYKSFIAVHEETPYSRRTTGLDQWEVARARNIECAMKRQGFPMEQIEAVMDVLPRALRQSSHLKFYSDLVQAQCQLPNRMFPLRSLPDAGSEPKPSEFAGRIDQTLTGGQPIGLGFCSGVLENKAPYRGVRARTRNIELRSDCGLHAALIIGRELRDGKCMLLVRNSWGTSCNPYHSSRRRDCETAGPGNIWMESHELLDGNTVDLTWLK